MKVITEEKLKKINNKLVCMGRISEARLIQYIVENEMEEISAIHEENGQIIVDELRPMSDEELLGEALDCIYEIRGAYIDLKDSAYERHRDQLNDLERVTMLLEKRLNA